MDQTRLMQRRVRVTVKVGFSLCFGYGYGYGLLTELPYLPPFN